MKNILYWLLVNFIFLCLASSCTKEMQDVEEYGNRLRITEAETVIRALEPIDDQWFRGIIVYHPTIPSAICDTVIVLKSSTVSCSGCLDNCE